MSASRRRRAAILKAIEAGAVRSQRELVDLLSAQGFATTQATLSRDISGLGLVKRGGRYVSPGAPPPVGGLTSSLADRIYQVDRAGANLVVVKTGAGEAGAVGLELDRVGFKEIVGTIAGDDTVFLACRDERAGRRICKQLKALIKE